MFQFLSPFIFPLNTQTGYSAVVLPSWPAGQRTRRLPTSPWHKTNLSAFICVGGSPLKALLQDWRSPISTISFWQAAGGVTWHQLCADGTWQARRSVMSAITGGKLVPGWTGKLRFSFTIKHRHICACTYTQRQEEPGWNTSRWSKKISKRHCGHYTTGNKVLSVSPAMDLICFFSAQSYILSCHLSF